MSTHTDTGHPPAQAASTPAWRQTRAAWAALGYVAAVAAAGGVFMMYLQPHFLRDLADQIWACF